jgi:hypothetical protein
MGLNWRYRRIAQAIPPEQISYLRILLNIIQSSELLLLLIIVDGCHCHDHCDSTQDGEPLQSKKLISA